MGIILNKGQRDIVRQAVKWYRSGNEQVFQIQGPPGTGKSVTINAIVDALRLDRDRVAPMSYIGGAAINMRVKGFYNAKTIHSWLYRPIEVMVYDKNNKIVIDPYFNKPKKRLSFEPKPLGDIDLMVIDEAYTTPLSMKDEIESRNKPIIAAGDRDQLSPVKDRPAYLECGKIHYLTEIMRQDAGSAIIYLSQRINNGLPIHSGWYGNVLVIEREELTDQMIAMSDVVICGKNDTRDYYNKYIRENLKGIMSTTPVYGEKMVCRKNNFGMDLDGICLANGLIGKVKNFVDATCFNGKQYIIDFQPDLMPLPFKRLHCDYKYLISSAQKRQELKSNPEYANGEMFEYAYAITTHIAQGSEWNKGIYIEENLGSAMNTKLNYVGLTRFKDRCIFVRRPRKHYY